MSENLSHMLIIMQGLEGLNFEEIAIIELIKEACGYALCFVKRNN